MNKIRLTTIVLVVIMIGCCNRHEPPGYGLWVDFIPSSSNSLQLNDPVSSDNQTFIFVVVGNNTHSDLGFENAVSNVIINRGMDIVAGGSARETVFYQVERCLSMTVSSDKTLFGRAPGTDLSDLFVLSSDNWYVPSKSYNAQQGIKEWKVEDYVKNKPYVFPSFKLQYIGKENVQDSFRLCILLDNGNELNCFFGE